MSKELVISAASHERRVAILEEGQLVEIYIEREKEFALVGSIYKGRVTRVLPGMQSAFVDIGLDGDAFLYVSDVFENLEDYDHGHGHPEPQLTVSSPVASVTMHVEELPGETISATPAIEHIAEGSGEQIHPETHEGTQDETLPGETRFREARHEQQEEGIGRHEEQGAGFASHELAQEHETEASADAHAEGGDEQQPDSNASAPQNFSQQYNPTQKYAPRSDRGPGRGNPRGNDRSGQGYGRGNEQGGNRGRGNQFGRRGGRRRGGSGRPQGGGPGGRNLPPSKYASPQGSSQQGSQGYEQRDRGSDDSRRFNDRHSGSGGPRHSGPAAPVDASAEEPILLPGESLAKYRNKPAAPLAPPPTEQEAANVHSEEREAASREAVAAPVTATTPAGNVPRRSTGLPRWLLAESGAEAESSTGAQEIAGAVSDSSSAAGETHAEPESLRTEPAITEEEAVVLSSALVEAKHEETQDEAEADTLVGGAEFENEEDDDEEAESEENSLAAEVEAAATSEELAEQDDSEDEVEESEPRSAEEVAEAEADAAHDDAIAAAGEQGDHVSTEAHADGEGQPGSVAPVEDDSILLPGETRSPRSSSEPREEFPRTSARIGGNPRARFQRPFRSGSGGGNRDRGRDNRGGDRGGDRGGRPDRRGGRPGGRPGGGPRFERRPGGGPPRGQQHRGHSGPPRRPQLISEMLRAGQDVVVQIAKEPLGKKGARITSHVALPGRFLVYMPTVHHTGVSRKIVSAENRSRLRRLVSEAGGAYPGGFIVRTAAGGATDDEIRADIDFLGKTWNEIKERNDQRKAPSLLHRDLNLVERILRDYVSDDFTGIWIDNEEEYGKIVEFVSRFQPKLVNKVKLYSKETPIFEEFGIQHELDKALRAKVWLKSGGYIVINHTEALVAIDVNTGKFVGKGSIRLEDTIVKTNLEAVKEIVRQIRLRDLGGIIVVDFIDMEERRNRDKVLAALQQALEEDKAPSKALSFNEFGLVCITRKRTKQALERVLCQPCPYCTGSGMVKSIPTLCYEIQTEARKMALAGHEEANLTLRVHPEIAKALKTREALLIDELEQTTHKHIIIQSDATLHWEQYDIY